MNAFLLHENFLSLKFYINRASLLQSVYEKKSLKQVYFLFPRKCACLHLKFIDKDKSMRYPGHAVCFGLKILISQSCDASRIGGNNTLKGIPDTFLFQTTYVKHQTKNNPFLVLHVHAELYIKQQEYYGKNSVIANLG